MNHAVSLTQYKSRPNKLSLDLDNNCQLEKSLQKRRVLIRDMADNEITVRLYTR